MGRIRIPVLVVVLAVLGWRVWSCQQEIEAKRAAAERLTAHFEARTREERSPFPLDPYRRRAAIADAHRLRPDRRFLLALGRIAQWTGRTGAAAATFKDRRWTISVGGGEVGRVAEFPDFGELMDAAVRYAHPRTGARARQSPALLWEPEARATLARALPAVRKDAAAPELHDAARAATSLAFYLVDSMEAADDLFADAIALSALDPSARKDDRAVLAAALGYGGAARELGAGSDDPALRAYFAGQDAALKQEAQLRGASAATRYLLVRRFLEREDYAPLWEWLQSDHGSERVELATVAALLNTSSMRDYGAAAGALPLFLAAAAEGAPAVPSRAEREQLALARAAGYLIGALNLDPNTIGERLDKALGKLDPDVALYLRATWLSALRSQGEYVTDGLGDRDGAEKMSAWLKQSTSETVRGFQRWFDVRVRVERSPPVQVLGELSLPAPFGGGAAVMLIHQAGLHADYSDPRMLRIVRTLIPRLDTRVGHRADLSSIAWNWLQDVPLGIRLGRSALEADPGGRRAKQREWLAAATGDADTLEQIGGDRSVLPWLRIAALEKLAEIEGGAAPRAVKALYDLVDQLPENNQASMVLAKKLRSSGKLDEAREVVTTWLRRNEQTNPLATGYAQCVLSMTEYLAGNYAKGLQIIQPAVERVGNSCSYNVAGLHLAALQRKKEAEEMARDLVGRYSGAGALAGGAEIEWRLGDVDAAAKILSRHEITYTEWRDDVGKVFAESYGKRPASEALAVTAALIKAGVDKWNVDELGVAMDQAGFAATAFEIHRSIAADGPARVTLVLRAAESLRKARGEAEATRWAQEQLAKTGQDSRTIALVAFRDDVTEAVWRMPPSDSDVETVWMLRAAAVARQRSSASKERLETLRTHYGASKNAAREVQIGRYLIGDAQEADVAKLVTNIPASCEVPYYFGVRAEGEGRWRDAVDWYRVAVECGDREEGEYSFATNALYRLRGDPVAMARIASAIGRGTVSDNTRER